MEHVCVNYNNNKKCLISATVCEYIIETTSFEKEQSIAYSYILKQFLQRNFILF